MPKRIRITTPPPELQSRREQPEGTRPQLSTPQRSAIFAVFYYCQQKTIPCSLQSFSGVFDIPVSTISDVISSGRCRRLQNSDEVDNRLPLRQLSRSDTNAIATYLDEAPLEEKSLPWQVVAENAGVVKEYRHERGQPNIQWSSSVIQRRVTADEGIKTHRAVVKEKHDPEQIKLRLEYCRIQLQQRLSAKDWRNVLWCDEIHWMTGPRYPKNIKRRAGDRYKYHPSNIQYERNHKPNPDLQKHFHIYAVIGFDFAFAIPYDEGNKNGKMNTKTYINVILPTLRQYILERGGEYILWQDRDSAHISKTTLDYMDYHGMGYILSLLKSPDMSIMETWVSPIRRKFYYRCCATQRQGVRRFYDVWEKLDPKKINKTINNYPTRLYEIVNTYQGRASKY